MIYSKIQSIEKTGHKQQQMNLGDYLMVQVRTKMVHKERVLAKEGYIPSKFTAGLYTHKTRKIAFSLVVDGFGVKYIHKEDADHLATTIGNR